MFYFLLISFFLYFGSGAGASEKAKLPEKTAICIIVFPPILSNRIKMQSNKRVLKIAEANSHFIAGVFMALFVTYHSFIDFLGS